MIQLQAFFCFLLRLALAISLLSGVADRFGFLGSPGTYNIIWGNFQNYIAFTRKIEFFFPWDWIPFSAWTMTVLELILGILLLIGLFHRFACFATGFLIFVFGIGMALAFGIKFPINYSVFIVAASAFLLGTVGPGWLATDQFRN